MKTIAILVGVLPVVFSLTACVAETRWVGGSPLTIDRDLYECRRDLAMLPQREQSPPPRGPGSSGAAIGYGIGSGLQSAGDQAQRRRFFTQCMKAHGWTKGD